jgi:DNA repair ATPase RecN
MNAMNISNSIKQITVENFQSWKKGTIELAPNGQLTVLTGSSDSGKTAIGIRALRWLLYNIPQGTDFIRVGCTFARVSVLYESGHTVIRERSTSKNQYKIILLKKKLVWDEPIIWKTDIKSTQKQQ